MLLKERQKEKKIRRRYKQLLDDFKEKRRQWKSKEEALDCPITRLGRDYGPVIRCDCIYCVYRWRAQTDVRVRNPPPYPYVCGVEVWACEWLDTDRQTDRQTDKSI